MENKKLKLVFISGMLPNGHYSQYITSGLISTKDIDLIVYTDKNPKNLEISGCGDIKLVWTKSPKFLVEILSALLKDRPNIVHLQHEMNMYGGPLTAVMFPFLIFALRILGFKVVTTVHASVFKDQVDKKFVNTFGYNPDKIPPFVVKSLFTYLYSTITNLSNLCIVHTNLAKEILTKDYFAPSKKLFVVPIAIPSRSLNTLPKEKYFFYFGYMVRRKGLGLALEGFKKFIDKFPDSKFKFVLAGGVIKGQEKAYDEIKELILHLQLDSVVEIKGFIQQEEQDKLYEHAYAVVIPAILSMGSSGPLFHANSYGKCVLASDVGHFIEDIDNLKTGILVENNKWAEAFEYAVLNEDVVHEIEKAVVIKSQSRTPYKTAKIYLDLYTSL